MPAWPLNFRGCCPGSHPKWSLILGAKNFSVRGIGIAEDSLGALERVNGWETDTGSDTGSDLCQGDLDESEAD